MVFSQKNSSHVNNPYNVKDPEVAYLTTEGINDPSHQSWQHTSPQCAATCPPHWLVDLSHSSPQSNSSLQRFSLIGDNPPSRIPNNLRGHPTRPRRRTGWCRSDSVRRGCRFRSPYRISLSPETNRRTSHPLRHDEYPTMPRKPPLPLLYKLVSSFIEFSDGQLK